MATTPARRGNIDPDAGDGEESFESRYTPEFYNMTTGEICDAEEYLQAMGFQPVRVDHRLAPLVPGDNGRWEWLTVEDIKFLDSCGIEIGF